MRASSTPSARYRDFESYLPDVLVLAFDTLDKAQRYSLGLYRLGQALQPASAPDRESCSAPGTRSQQVFELCKQAYFDDYVLYWPQLHDGHRLAMTVWAASRDTRAPQRDTPLAGELLAHARQLGELEHTLDRGLADPSVGDAAWARRLRESLEPSLAETRGFADRVRKVRPLVLVVEDDEVQRLTLSRMIEPLECDALFVNDGRSALAQLRRVRPDVILMDLRLPGIDGIALTAQLKAMPALSSIPVVMMTGDARRETLTSSVEAGAVSFIVKPFSREVLKARLDKALGG